MELGVKELIKLCIYCRSHPLHHILRGSPTAWMLLSGNLKHGGGEASRRSGQLLVRCQDRFVDEEGLMRMTRPNQAAVILGKVDDVGTLKMKMDRTKSRVH